MFFVVVFQVEEKIKEKAQLVADIEEMDERLDALNHHLSNISNEQTENHVRLNKTVSKSTSGINYLTTFKYFRNCL